jgi:hypothetical protein
MKTGSLAQLTTDDLVTHFVGIMLLQDKALIEDDDVGKYNLLYQQALAIVEELRARPGDQRRELVKLYGHDNPQVRLMAAKWTFALEPERARHVLQDLHDRQVFLYGGSAGMTLWMLDSGRYVPT